MLARECWLEFFNRKGINMHYAPAIKKSLFSAAVCALLAAAPTKATIYDEAVSGDLSNDKGAPTALTLTPGLNSVIGTVNGFGNGDPQDWVSFTIPTGFVMTSYVNSKYDSTDDQGFTGFQFGSSFLGDEFTAGNYAGYAHFGTGATNPDGTPPLSTVGVNLLPLMANSSFAPGAAGFTPPLGAGTYTFLIQQGDTFTTSYQFDMNIRPVPEPGSSLCLLGMGGLAILALRRRLGYLRTN
jgi:PEP-CTERM motif